MEGRASAAAPPGREGVQVVHGLRRAEAAEATEDDGQEGALLGDGAGEVLVVQNVLIRVCVESAWRGFAWVASEFPWL